MEQKNAQDNKVVAKQKFLEYAAALKLESQIDSSFSSIIHSENLKKIVSLGEVAIEFIIDDMRISGFPWYHALEQLTGENPVTTNNWGDIPAMNQQWITWYNKRTKDEANKRFDIDFFELIFLAEACIPPTPIARSMFWTKFTFEFYKDLTTEERKQAYEWLMRTPSLQRVIETKNHDALAFEARYNPENQYIVETTDGNKYQTFSWEGFYYVDQNKWIPHENIERVYKPENTSV